MGRKTSEKVGRGPCPSKGCTETVTFRKSSGGMLCHSCEKCDSSGYAEPSGEAYTARMASLTGAAQASDPAPTMKAATLTRPKGYDMGEL